MIDLKKVSEMLGVCELTVKEWTKEGKIKCTYIDNEMFFNPNDIEDFINKTKIKLITPDHQMDELKEFLDNGFYSAEGDKSMDNILNSYCKKNDVLSPEEIEKLFNKGF